MKSLLKPSALQLCFHWQFQYPLFELSLHECYLYHTASDNMHYQSTSTHARTPLTFHDENFMFHFFALLVVVSDAAEVFSTFGVSSLVLFLLLVCHKQQQQIKLVVSSYSFIKSFYQTHYWKHKELSLPSHSLILVLHLQHQLPVKCKYIQLVQTFL